MHFDISTVAPSLSTKWSKSCPIHLASSASNLRGANNTFTPRTWISILSTAEIDDTEGANIT